MHIGAGGRDVAEGRSPKSAVIFLFKSHGAAARITEAAAGESNADIVKSEIGKQCKGRDPWSENRMAADTMSPAREDC